ncbi:hypothetical protein [Pseudanabaena minima]
MSSMQLNLVIMLRFPSNLPCNNSDRLSLPIKPDRLFLQINQRSHPHHP